MEIVEHKSGAVTVLRPDGPLAGEDAEQFRVRFMEAVHEHLGRVVLDASVIPVVDSRGLEALVDITAEVSSSGQYLKLCGANDTIREVFELTGLSSQFEHFEDATSAVRSFL